MRVDGAEWVNHCPVFSQACWTCWWSGPWRACVRIKPCNSQRPPSRSDTSRWASTWPPLCWPANPPSPWPLWWVWAAGRGCQWTGHVIYSASEQVMWFTVPVNWSCYLQCQWTGHVIYSASEQVMWFTVPVNRSCDLHCQWTGHVIYSASEQVMWFTVPVNRSCDLQCQWTSHVNYSASEQVMWITMSVNRSCEL